MNKKVDAFFENATKWKEELLFLRKIASDSVLQEDLKWGQPCYSYNDTNLVILGELKECCVFSFFKGALLKDPEKILTKPGANTQSARIIRFTSLAQIKKLAPVLKIYINEAIEAEKAGLKVEFKKADEHNIPSEFENAMKKEPALRKAFRALTPGRQRAYLLHFSQAKQSKTREARIDKFRLKILEGKGMLD